MVSISDLPMLRAAQPQSIAAALAARTRRPWLSETKRIFLIAADHTARGVLAAGGNPQAMANRADLLERLVIALGRPGVDGVLGSADILEDLALLGALDGRLAVGSMNRGGLSGSVFELDDAFTGYSADAIASAGLDAGKMMLRVADDDPATLATLQGCATAIDGLAAHRLPAMVEVFASHRSGGRAANHDDADSLICAIAVAAGLGSTSAYTWLKLPVIDDMERVMAATTLPTVLLGGDPGTDLAKAQESWGRAAALPGVVGLVVGRTLLYPKSDDVAGAVDAAAGVLLPVRA